MHYIRSFLKGCQICQLNKARPAPQRQFESRVSLNYNNMGKLSCDIKYMYRANIGHKFILVVTDEVTTYLVTIPLIGGTSHKVEEALINHVFGKHGPPSYLIFDEDKLFLSGVMQPIYKRLGIKIKIVKPT